MSSTQHKLDKARPPRVQITYDVEIGNAKTAKELPLVIGVMGSFHQKQSHYVKGNLLVLIKITSVKLCHQ